MGQHRFKIFKSLPVWISLFTKAAHESWQGVDTTLRRGTVISPRRWTTTPYVEELKEILDEQGVLFDTPHGVLRITRLVRIEGPFAHRNDKLLVWFETYGLRDI